jgi:hypothetical protein
MQPNTYTFVKEVMSQLPMYSKMIALLFAVRHIRNDSIITKTLQKSIKICPLALRIMGLHNLIQRTSSATFTLESRMMVVLAAWFTLTANHWMVGPGQLYQPQCLNWLESVPHGFRIGSSSDCLFPPKDAEAKQDVYLCTLKLNVCFDIFVKRGSYIVAL